MPSSGYDLLTDSFSAESLLPDPVDALRAALFAVGKQMAGVGFAPPHLASMRWSSVDPTALDPERMAVNLAYREAFVGFRPPIERVAAAHPGVRVEVTCTRSATPPPEAIVELERDYSARRGVDMEAVLGQWREEGKAARQRLLAAGLARIDVRFGEGPFSTLDLFLPESEGPHPCWIFLHGGYWMATDKAQYAQFAAGLLAAGMAVALPNYPLAPEVSVRRQVADSALALRFLHEETARLQLDPSAFHLAGHSAGAHLAALVATEPDAPPLRSLTLLSGLYDAGALGPTALGRLIGFADPETAAALAAHNRPAPHGARIMQALGGLEAAGFFREAEKLEKLWNLPPVRIIEAANHFTLLEGLKSGPLLDEILSLSR